MCHAWADIDECVRDGTICGPNSNCTNSVGSYSCSCLTGFELNNPEVIASTANPCTGMQMCQLLVSFIFMIIYFIFDILSPLQILMSAARHRAYVANKLCVLMYQGRSIVLVLMDSSHQLELCGH